MLRAFIRMNQAVCTWLEQYLPNARGHTYRLYPELVARHIIEHNARIVVDVGGGKCCAFIPSQETRWGAKVIAVDISAEELRHNSDVNARVVSDVSRGVPFGDGSVDIMASRSVLEHLNHLEGFVREASRTLRRGGYFIHWIPCKFAPFALINQMLPHRVARRLLYFFEPGARGMCGFPAAYDRCYPFALQRLFGTCGFEILEMRPSYFQSRYFSFFVPFFLMSSAYEIVIQCLGLRNLCAHVLLVARKT